MGSSTDLDLQNSRDVPTETEMTQTLTPEQKKHIEELKNDLLKCIGDGVGAYNNLMNDLLDTKQPLKDSQLQDYHSKNLLEVTAALKASYKDLNSLPDPTLKDYIFGKIIPSAVSRLELEINMKFNDIHLRKHEIHINQFVQKIKGLKNQAEMLYDENADEFMTTETKVKDAISAHEKWVPEVIQKFKELLKENEIEFEKHLQYELEHNLNERRQDLLEECQDYVPKAPFQDAVEPAKQEAEAHTAVQLPTTPTIPQPDDHKSEEPVPTSTTVTPPESTPTANKHKLERHQRMDDTMKSIKIDSTEFEDGQITTRTLNSTHPNTLFATFKHLREAKLEDLKTNPQQELKKRLAKSQGSTETKQIGIGIYINQNSFQLGFVDPNKKALASISITPDIAFTNRSIKVGEDALRKGVTSNNFNIFELITSQSPKLPGSIAFHGNVCTPCVHEIIAIFFSAVFASFEDSNGVQIDNIVVTIPFPLTSMVKERILKALQILGFTKVQILSTLLTTAITQVFEKEYYKNVGKPQEDIFPKTLLVLDYQPTSFTMGIVELSRSTISGKVSYGSDSISECQDKSFMGSHKNLYDRDDDPPQTISAIYKAAIEHVKKVQSSLPVIKIAVSDSSSKFIDKALPKMFRDIWKFTSLTTSKGPLMGAALLASASTEAAPNSLTSLLPPNIKIKDATRSFLNLTKELRGKKKNYPSSVLMKNVVDERILIHEEIRLRLNRFNEGPTVVDFLLEEHLVSLEGETTQIFPAGHYKLALPCRPTEDKEGERFYDNIEITCTMEANGLLSLRCKNAEGISLNMEMARKDNSTCVENCEK